MPARGSRERLQTRARRRCRRAPDARSRGAEASRALGKTDPEAAPERCSQVPRAARSSSGGGGSDEAPARHRRRSHPRLARARGRSARPSRAFGNSRCGRGGESERRLDGRAFRHAPNHERFARDVRNALGTGVRERAARRGRGRLGESIRGVLLRGRALVSRHRTAQGGPDELSQGARARPRPFPGEDPTEPPRRGDREQSGAPLRRRSRGLPVPSLRRGDRGVGDVPAARGPRRRALCRGPGGHRASESEVEVATVAKLLVKRAGALEQEIELKAAPLTIGRAADNDVVLVDASISRHHARIEPAGGEFRIIDLDSGNGVVHEGQRVTELRLSPGCEVGLGEYTLTLDGSVAAAAPGPKLVLIAGGKRRAHTLLGAETLVGRSEDADLRVEDPLVSSQHFKISKKGDVYALVDLGSENGTYVNGVRTRERELAEGDQIRVAGITFFFAADGVEPEPGGVEILEPSLSPAPPVRPRPTPGAARPAAAAPMTPGPQPGTSGRSIPRLLLLGGGLLVVVLVLVALVLLRSPENAAEKEFQDVFQSDLSVEARQRIEEYQARAADYEARGNLELALEQHRKILVLDPTHQVSLAETARLEEELETRRAQQEEQARETRERLAQMAELTERADRALAASDFAEARNLLESAKEMSPDSEVVSSRIAAAWAAEGDYYRSRDVGRARSAYQRALEIDPELEEARRGLDRIQQSQQASRRKRARSTSSPSRASSSSGESSFARPTLRSPACWRSTPATPGRRSSRHRRASFSSSKYGPSTKRRFVCTTMETSPRR